LFWQAGGAIYRNKRVYDHSGRSSVVDVSVDGNVELMVLKSVCLVIHLQFSADLHQDGTDQYIHADSTVPKDF
jgi:hypothetical protein